MPWTLVIERSSRATERALHPRRLYVNASCAPKSNIKTDANQIQPVKLLFKGVVCNLCRYWVYSRAAWTPGKANHIHPAAQSVRRDSYSHLEILWIRSKRGEESRRKCACWVLWHAYRLKSKYSCKTPTKSSNKLPEFPPAIGVWYIHPVLHLQ